MALADTDDYKLGDMLGIFWRWRRLALAAFAVVLIPGLLVTFLMPRVYEATATVMVNRTITAPAYSVKIGQTLDASSILRSVNRDEEIKTAAETVKTRAVIDAVIEKLRLTSESLKNIRDFRRYVQMVIDVVIDTADWIYSELKYAVGLSKRPTAEEKAFMDSEQLVENVDDRIKIKPVPDTNMLKISFRAGDPFLAQKVINEVVNEFIAAQPRVKESSRTFFADEAQSIAEQLRVAEEKLAEYRQKTSAYAVVTQRNLILQTIETLRANLTQTEAALAQKQAAVDTLQRRLQTEPQFQREISKSLIDAGVDLAGFKASAATLQAAIEARLEELSKLSDEEVQTRELERQVAKAEQAFELQQRNLEQARVTEKMASANLSELRVVDYATYPLSPVQPRSLIYLGVVVGASILAALASVFLAHLNDTTLSSAKDVARLIDVSFVATFPDMRRGRAARHPPDLLGETPGTTAGHGAS